MPARTQHAKKPTARPTPRKQISKVLTFRDRGVCLPDGTTAYVNYKLRDLFDLDCEGRRLRVTAAPRGKYKLRAIGNDGVWDLVVVDTTSGGAVGLLCAEATRLALRPLPVRSGARFDVRVLE